MLIYCINLDRSTERWEKMKKLFSQIFPNIQRFKAVEGAKLDVNRLTKMRMVSPYAEFNIERGRTSHDIFETKGAIGCYLSHLKLWELCIQRNENVMILEDDIVPTKDFNNENLNYYLNEIPKEAGIIIIGYAKDIDGQYDVNKKKGIVRLLGRFQGTLGYIVTPKAARALVSHAYPMFLHVDIYVGLACKSNGIPIYAPKDVSKFIFTGYEGTTIQSDTNIRDHLLFNYFQMKQSYKYDYYKNSFIVYFLTFLMIMIIIYIILYKEGSDNNINDEI